jgi:diadenosine tetraphosphatase ApaH/serine/threonine PP2A family protein phosphatase
MAGLADLSPSVFLDTLRENRHLSESELQLLLLKLVEILESEPNVLFLDSPITVCGDIHGQMLDLFRLFEKGGDPDSVSYLFLGDYVDHGYSSVETFAYLAFLKIRHPDSFFLLRGNHESREVNQVYGLYNDCQHLYGHSGTWLVLNEVFNCLPIAAVIDDRIFCVHGGLSTTVTYIDKLSLIDRRRELELPPPDSTLTTLSALEAQALVDLTWSDPEDVSQFAPNRRGKGLLFGPDQSRNFLWNNGLLAQRSSPEPLDPTHAFIARSHQIAMQGWSWMHHDFLVIVWSAPNYCYKSGNAACVMTVGTEGQMFVPFQKDRNSHIKPEDAAILYFA